MITIFNGRSRAIGNSKESVFIQVDALMREYFYVFKNGHDINAAGVFMVVALHADINGWAWPSTTLLCKETGLSTTDAVLRCIQHLRTVEINNEPILHHYLDLVVLVDMLCFDDAGLHQCVDFGAGSHCFCLWSALLCEVAAHKAPAAPKPLGEGARAHVRFFVVVEGHIIGCFHLPY